MAGILFFVGDGQGLVCHGVGEQEHANGTAAGSFFGGVAEPLEDVEGLDFLAGERHRLAAEVGVGGVPLVGFAVTIEVLLVVGKGWAEIFQPTSQSGFGLSTLGGRHGELHGWGWKRQAISLSDYV